MLPALVAAPVVVTPEHGGSPQGPGQPGGRGEEGGGLGAGQEAEQHQGRGTIVTNTRDTSGITRLYVVSV